jgi:hypothetical protein
MPTQLRARAKSALVLAALLSASLPSQVVERPALVSNPVSGSVLSYDVARDRFVLFDGHLWDWTGSGWLSVSAWSRPVDSASLTYDTVHRRLLIQTSPSDPLGYPSWLDSFDGRSSEESVHVGCLPRSTALAFDTRRQRAVRFGFMTRRGTLHAETQEFDGRTWQIVMPQTRPPLRREFGLAYDARRGVTVMFGGFDSQAVTDATWEWNGLDWTLRAPANRPPPRYRAAMAYDAVARRVVMYGGTDGNHTSWTDTWEWDGNTWTLRNNPAAMPAGMASLASSDRQLLLVIQGASRTTWDWTSLGWRRLHEQPAPGLAVAYDSLRDRLVTLPWQGGVCEWDGTAWLWLNPSGPTPPPSGYTTLCYDARRRVTVCVSWPTGGGSGTWSWNGTTWQAFAGGEPPPRGGHALGFDPLLGEVVLFGGRDAAGPRNDLWRFDGSRWLQITTTGLVPPPQLGAAMTFDYARQSLMVLGVNAAGVTQVYELRAGAWGLLPTPSLGGASRGLATDPTRRRVIAAWSGGYALWDGLRWSNRLEPAWSEHVAFDSFRTSFVANSWHSVAYLGSATMPLVDWQGKGCGAPMAARLTTRGLGVIGDAAFGFEVLDAPPLRPVALLIGDRTAAIPYGGECALRVDPARLFAVLAAGSSAGGSARFGLPLPRLLPLADVSLVVQALTGDPTQPLGLGASDLLKFKPGR